MLSKSELWKIIEPVACEAGLELFDIDLPSGSSGGVLRIFIANAAKNNGTVTLDDCATLSKKLGALTAFEELLPEKTTLEVSSPGVNRRLRRVEHFSGAVGEHLKLKVCDSSNKKSVIIGTLISFDGSTLCIRNGEEEEQTVTFEDIEEAHVDFIFQ